MTISVALRLISAGTARAFDDDDVVLGPEGVQGRAYRVPKLGFQPEVVPGSGGVEGAAHEDNLGGMVGLWLEQDRVHFHAGFDAGGLGLDGLGAADFAAVGGDVGVVGHILGLEGGDTEPVLAEDAAQRRNQDALANVGGGPLDHQYSAGHGQSRAGIPARWPVSL